MQHHDLTQRPVRNVAGIASWEIGLYWPSSHRDDAFVSTTVSHEAQQDCQRRCCPYASDYLEIRELQGPEYRGPAGPATMVLCPGLPGIRIKRCPRRVDPCRPTAIINERGLLGINRIDFIPLEPGPPTPPLTIWVQYERVQACGFGAREAI